MSLNSLEVGWDVGESISIRWQKNRLHHESKVCCLSFLSADGFLLGGFEKKNLFDRYTEDSSILLKDPKDEYIVLFSQRNFCLVWGKKHTISIYELVFYSLLHLLDIFTEIWLEVILTQERLCMWWEGQEQWLWSNGVRIIVPYFINFPSFPF